MKDFSLFTLTDTQKIQYRSQPDELVDFDWIREDEDDQEIIQYMPGTAIRFWYNTETMCYGTHWHNSIEIIVPLENTYDAIIQDQRYCLAPGDILIVPAGHLHETIAPPTGSRFVFCFELDFLSHLQGYSYIASLLSEPILINDTLCPEIYAGAISQIMQLAGHYWGNSIAKEVRIYAGLMEFFSVYVDYHTYQKTGLEHINATEGRNLNTKLTVAFDYLEYHFQEDIALEDVADAAGFSKFHFCRIFKECTGKTFREYLALRRIKAAEMLLTNPNLHITDIAMQCGFNSLSVFNRTFKQCKHCTPSEFRQFHTEPLSSAPM